MLIHRLDFDDTHYGALIHTGSITVPAAIYSSFLKKPLVRLININMYWRRACCYAC